MEPKVYLNRYRLYADQIGLPLVIRRSAGEGTFKAVDLQEHKDVALQVVSITELRTVVREQLEAEAMAAGQINHINIPVFHQFGIEDGQIVYVTEYFEGTTAGEWVKTVGPLPVGAVMRIAQQIVNASSVATFHGIVHHAINPSNIMLVPGRTAEGEWPLIKLLNIFGVAPNLTPPETPDPQSVDPINFASPEQVQTGKVDFRSQMYSLGATLWFLLTGSAPLEGATSLNEATQVPLAVRQLLRQMLAADPAERPLDPLALQSAIRETIDQMPRRDAAASKPGLPLAPAATVNPDEPVPVRPLTWKPLALAALLIGLATVAAVSIAQYSRSRQAIGVPVGVPENVAASSAKTVEPAQNPSPVTATPAAEVAQATAAPVLVSNVEGQPSPPQESASASAQPYASNSPPAAPEAQEPAPPSEGPRPTVAPAARAQNTAVAQNQPPAITNVPEPAHTQPADPEPVAKPVKREQQPTTAAAAKRTTRRSSSTAASETSGLPAGAMRARYLGTTPEGELVFGLPNNDRVYAAPDGRVLREETTRKPRRPRRAPKAEVFEGVPVLPALPADG